MFKNVGGAVTAQITVQHKGAAINGIGEFWIGAGSPSVAANDPSRRGLYTRVNRTPISFQQDIDWTPYTFQISGTYPVLAYESGYNKADVGIDIVNEADQALAGSLFYDDVYELSGTPPPPTKESSPVVAIAIVGGALAVTAGIIAAIRGRRKK